MHDKNDIELREESPSPERQAYAGLTADESVFLDSFSDQDQKKIYRKTDLHLVPFLMLLYLFANLDRANIGNAKIEGLEKSLGMTGTDYNVATMVFFVSYIVCEVPSNWILVKFKRPSTYLGIIVTAWGIIMTLSGVVQNFGGLVATRFLLGVFEAGFFPGAIFLISQWYPPHMMQLRMAMMYGAAALSGAFSGLLAAGIAQMNGVGGYEGWRWIFLLEGLGTVLGGILTFFVLPDSPSASKKWLSDREAEFLQLTYKRYRGGGRSAEEDKTVKQSKLKSLLAIFTDWQLYLQSMIFMSSSVPTYALKFTLPQIIRNMGFTSTNAQLLTAPPYVLGAISAVISALFADRLSWRWPFVVGPQSLLTICYAVLFVFSPKISSNIALCYTFVCCSTVSVYPIVPCGNTWTANNLAPQAKRAMGIAFMVALGNIGGIIGSFIFKANEAPAYPSGWGTCIAFVVAGAVCATILEVTYLTINKRRAAMSEEQVREKYSAEELDKMGDRSPLYRYVL